MKLKRLEDSSGSSEGWWIVEDVPGAIVWRDHEGWRVICSPLLFGGLERRRAEETWGASWQEAIESTQLMTEGLTQRAFKTRSEALHSLERQLGEKPRGMLGEMI